MSANYSPVNELAILEQDMTDYGRNAAAQAIFDRFYARYDLKGIKALYERGGCTNPAKLIELFGLNHNSDSTVAFGVMGVAAL